MMKLSVNDIKDSIKKERKNLSDIFIGKPIEDLFISAYVVNDVNKAKDELQDGGYYNFYEFEVASTREGQELVNDIRLDLEAESVRTDRTYMPTCSDDKPVYVLVRYQKYSQETKFVKRTL